MADSAHERIRLTVLGGFLGAGKTTWLRHQLHHGLTEGALVVVNEAAQVPVDNVLLSGSPHLAVLAGGCACCEGRDAFISLLRDVCDVRVASDDQAERIDRIVLETSGLADPGAIVDAIKSDPVLIHHIVVSEIVVSVDALHGLDQLKREPLGRRQVEIADRLVVTKVDAAGDETLRPLLATLKELNPGAVISGAAMGSGMSLPDFEHETAVLLPELPGATAPIKATAIDIDETIDWAAFSVWLSALLYARGDDIMRVKGVVRTPAGRLLLQSVRHVVQSPEILPDGCEEVDGKDNSIVIIGRGFDPKSLLPSLRYFADRPSCPRPPCR